MDASSVSQEAAVALARAECHRFKAISNGIAPDPAAAPPVAPDTIAIEDLPF